MAKSNDKSGSKQKKPRKKRTTWKKEELIRYVIFISAKIEAFQSMIKDKQIFSQMAEYIQSKTLTECNWFHFRTKFKYKSNEKIIENMMKNLQMDPEQAAAKIQKIRNNDMLFKTKIKEQALNSFSKYNNFNNKKYQTANTSSLTITKRSSIHKIEKIYIPIFQD